MSAIKSLSLALLAATAYANPLVVRDSCGSNYKSCSPKGATGTDPPAVGNDMSGLYSQLLTSVKSINFAEDTVERSVPALGSLQARADASLCCATGTACVNLAGPNIAFCYDKFTTNYVFGDGSYGNVNSGDYSAKNGDHANLLTGNYTLASGQSGNVYGDDQGAQPNTATLSIPPVYTASGVGSAIAVSQLAYVTVFTTTIPGTTITGATVLPGTTIMSGSVAVSTEAPSTITQATTIAPKTSVVTSSVMAAATAAKSKGAAAGPVAVDRSTGVGMGLLTGLLYFIYAL